MELGRKVVCTSTSLLRELARLSVWIQVLELSARLNRCACSANSPQPHCLGLAWSCTWRRRHLFGTTTDLERPNKRKRGSGPSNQSRNAVLHFASSYPDETLQELLANHGEQWLSKPISVLPIFSIPILWKKYRNYEKLTRARKRGIREESVLWM